MSLTRATILAAFALAASVPTHATEIRDPARDGEPPPGIAPRTSGAERPAPVLRDDSRRPPVPGTVPGTNIGGTPTSGPPGTGGAAGGPSIGGQ